MDEDSELLEHSGGGSHPISRSELQLSLCLRMFLTSLCCSNSLKSRSTNFFSVPRLPAESIADKISSYCCVCRVEKESPSGIELAVTRTAGP